MARHIYIGNCEGSTYTNGLLGQGALDTQKPSLSGPTTLVLGDIRQQAEQIRIVQGGATANIVSPWVYGDDIINWDKKAYLAPTAHSHTVTYSGTTTAAGSIDITFIRTDSAGANEFYSFSTDIASGVGAAAIGALVQTAYQALTTVPDWLITTTGTGTTNVFSGATAGTAGGSGGELCPENPALFAIKVSNTPAGLTTTWTISSAPTTAGATGVGDGYLIRKIEEQWWGNQFGYYDRVQLPKPPVNYSTLTDNYDVYSIAATKDGSSQSQIHGVDNVMEISVALDQSCKQTNDPWRLKMNDYMNDCGFGSV